MVYQPIELGLLSSIALDLNSSINIYSRTAYQMLHAILGSSLDMSGLRWKKGKYDKDFAALAAAKPMSSIVSELQSWMKRSNLVATLSSRGEDAVLGLNPQLAALLNRASFGQTVEMPEQRNRI